MHALYTSINVIMAQIADNIKGGNHNKMLKIVPVYVRILEFVVCRVSCNVVKSYYIISMMLTICINMAFQQPNLLKLLIVAAAAALPLRNLQPVAAAHLGSR